MRDKDTSKKRSIFALLAFGAAAVLLAGALFGCSSEPAESPSDAGGEATTTDEPIANAVNPWIDATSVDEMAAKAGFDVVVVDTPQSSFGSPVAVHYRAMEGMAEVIYEYPACEIRVRKGLPSLGENGDISGDWGDYVKHWTMTGVGVNSVDVACDGNTEGVAAKCMWNIGDYAYSATATALGGEEDFGLQNGNVAAFVDAVV